MRKDGTQHYCGCSGAPTNKKNVCHERGPRWHAARSQGVIPRYWKGGASLGKVIKLYYVTTELLYYVVAVLEYYRRSARC